MATSFKLGKRDYKAAEMSDLMAMEKVIIPKEFLKNTSVDFNNKNLELVSATKNYMFGEFQLMTIKPSKKVG